MLQIKMNQKICTETQRINKNLSVLKSESKKKDVFIIKNYRDFNECNRNS